MMYIKDNSPENDEDILDFANMVFSLEYGATDFSQSFPKAYGEGRRGLVTHHILKEDRIRAVIDTYPLRLRMGDKVINADYIGTVAVHPRTRGRGYFSKLMECVEKEALSKKTDLLILDGKRARYGNFGFESAGIKYKFVIEFVIEAALMTNDDVPFCFEEIDSDSKALGYLYKLYLKNNVTARDFSDFYVSLLSIKAQVFAVTYNDKVVGYVNLSEDEKTLYEFELEDESKTAKLVFDLLAGFDLDRLIVEVGADEAKKILQLEDISDSYIITTSHQLKILNYENVLEFLFRWKMMASDLEKGEYVFGIQEEKQTQYYKVAVDKTACSGNVEVVRLIGAQDIPCEVFSPREFIKIFTTPYYYVIENTQKAPKAPAGWLPLNFHLPNADTF